jgi:hypothetical protein
MLCGVTWRRWFRQLTHAAKQHFNLGNQTSKHQCTNNVHPRSQNGLHQPSQSQNQFLLTIWNRALMRILNMLLRWLSGPEKAGVGGSSPSLATTFSNTYRLHISSFGSNWFQYWLADGVSTSPQSLDHFYFAYPFLMR